MTRSVPDDATTQPAEDAYNPLLTRFLVNGLRRTVQQVQVCEPLVPDEVRVRAWHQLSYALRDRAVWPTTRELLLALAPKMEQAGFREEWIAYLSAGVEQSRTQEDAAALAEFALHIALLYRMIAEYDQAITWLNASLTHFRQQGDPRGQARALNEWAWVEHLRRRYAEATQYVDEALALLAADDPERGMCYRTQGMIAIYQGRWVEAEAHHRAALAIFKYGGNLRKVAWGLHNLATALRGQKKFEAAIEMFTHASVIMKELGDDYHWVTTQLNLGATHYHYGENDTAISYYLNAIVVARQSYDRKQLADIYTNLGLAYMVQGSNELASQSFQNAMRFYEELGIQSMVVNAMDGLAMCYIAQHQHKQALTVLEKALTMLPQIVNVPNYEYYEQSIKKHWHEASAEQELSIEPQADVV